MDTIDCPKCEHEHEPTGSHEDDIGEMECQECGFKFRVEIEYDPCYYTHCIECEFGGYAPMLTKSGLLIVRHCKHCQRCQIKGDENE